MGGTGAAKPPDVPDHAVAPRRSSWLRWALAAFLLAAIGGFSDSFSWQSLHDHLDARKAQANEHLLIALLVFFLVYLTMTALSLPAATTLTLLAGALFDLWLGVLVVSLASTLGATLAFLRWG